MEGMEGDRMEWERRTGEGKQEGRWMGGERKINV